MPPQIVRPVAIVRRLARHGEYHHRGATEYLCYGALLGITAALLVIVAITLLVPHRQSPQPPCPAENAAPVEHV